jgi:transketolase C-terminal domain/subunit
MEIPSVKIGSPKNYDKDQKLDNRSAFGNALVDLAKANLQGDGSLPLVVFDCDLAPSTKTTAFAKQFPNFFFQGGIQEHNTATIAGAISTLGLLSFFADFGVFGVDETYNQHRLNDINRTNLKLICTLMASMWVRWNTHQCIDYIGIIEISSVTKSSRPLIPTRPIASSDMWRKLRETSWLPWAVHLFPLFFQKGESLSLVGPTSLDTVRLT